jgi:hypothetical protein
LAGFFLNNPLSKGIEAKALFKLLYDKAILASDTQLKQNLVEVIDHKVNFEFDVLLVGCKRIQRRERKNHV